MKKKYRSSLRKCFRYTANFLSLRIDSITKIMIITLFSLILLSHIPPITIHLPDHTDFTLKRIDLLSDLKHHSQNSPSAPVIDATIDSITNNSASLTTDSKNTLPPTASTSSDDYKQLVSTITNGGKLPYVPFEDFSADRRNTLEMRQRIQQVKNHRGAYRIAFLGDSFIESDILTADIRSYLQSYYGGNGVGFVPIVSASPKYRRSVIHDFSNDWTTHSIVKYKEADWSKLSLPGYYYTPAEGSSVQLKVVPQNGDSSVSTAKFMFINEKETKIKIQINDKPHTYITPPSKRELQLLTFNTDIQRLSLQFENVEGFTAFGTFLNNSTGVYLDNYSARGSSGVALTACNEALSKQFNSHVPYDLIVLQYGLNVASAHITNYSYYKKSMVEVVRQLKGLFPQATIMIMSVADRAMNNNGQYETMPGIIAMVKVQRQIAQESGVMFWNTFEAMGGRNSMLQFVKQSMAGKDYTHITHAGGKRIAKTFVHALISKADSLTPQPHAEANNNKTNAPHQ